MQSAEASTRVMPDLRHHSEFVLTGVDLPPTRGEKFEEYIVSHRREQKTVSSHKHGST